MIKEELRLQLKLTKAKTTTARRLKGNISISIKSDLGFHSTPPSSSESLVFKNIIITSFLSRGVL